MSDRSGRSARALGIWIAFLFPLCVGLAGHWNYYFVAATEETGDAGANALQIQKAKHFAEIHGNYSRFHFNHPGPAFFYVYALGEAALHDAIPVAKAPGAAQSLAGLLLQCAFFAATLSVFSRFFSRLPTLVAAVAICSIHFFLTGSAFTSIWPPHQLLMPFFCALVTAAAVAAGLVSFLPLLVLSVCFCVHGHVAQPLFVLPAFFGAVGCAWVRAVRAGRKAGRSNAIRSVTRALFWNRFGAASALLAALFLLPLVIDACRGKASNFASILDYLRHPAAERKSLSASVVYFLSFMRYWVGLGAESTGTIAANLTRYSGFYLGWLAIFGSVALWVFRPRPPAPVAPATHAASPEQRTAFVAAGLVLTIFSGLLALYWGTRIEEGMFAFNSFFVYAILALPLLLGIGIAGESVRLPLSIALTVTVMAGARLCVLAHGQTLLQDSHLPVSDRVGQMEDFCRRDGLGELRSHSFVYLTFDHDEWIDAVAFANQLSRAHLDWRVPADWGFIFGSDHVLRAKDAPRLAHALRVMIDERQTPRSHPALQLHDQVCAALSNQAVTEISPAGFPLTFPVTSPLFDHALGLVSVDPNSDFVWSVGALTGFVLKPAPATADVILLLDLEPMVRPPVLSRQRFTVRFGETALGRFSISQRTPIALKIPRDVWNRAAATTDAVTLAFDWEDSVTPLHLDLNNDRRPLAVGFRAMRFGGPAGEKRPLTLAPGAQQ